VLIGFEFGTAIKKAGLSVKTVRPEARHTEVAQAGF
jgi:hypothetical protein